MRHWLSVWVLFGMGGICSALAAETHVTITGPERLVMPYSCAVESGVVSVRPGPERAFAIVEGRQQRPFTTCDPPFSNNCRSLMVHRFDVACGGERVPWIKVVAAIRRTAFGTASLQKGHLVLARKSGGSSGSAPSCTDAKSVEASRGECLPWKVARATEQSVLPQGFAPATEVGARFISGAGPAGSSSAIFTLAAASPGGSVSAARALDLGVTREDLPNLDIAMLPAPSLSSDFADQWVTTVVDRSTAPARHNTAAHGANSLPDIAPWLDLFMVLGLAAAAYVVRLHPQGLVLAHVSSSGAAMMNRLREAGTSAWDAVQAKVATIQAERAGQAEARQEPLLAAAAAQVRLKLAQTDALVSELGKAAVLREVLNGELTAVRQRLANAEAALRSGPANVMKLSAQFRAIDRDIDRIQRIAESAGQSLAGQQRLEVLRMPVTAAEAYDVIGANADTSDASLKRLVDALRMAWHPDFADPAKSGDLAAREERIKQINVAWDLVSAHRAAQQAGPKV